MGKFRKTKPVLYVQVTNFNGRRKVPHYTFNRFIPVVRTGPRRKFREKPTNVDFSLLAIERYWNKW